MLSKALLKLILLTKTFSISFLLVVLLCLGAQNLAEKKSLNLGFDRTAPLPTGFLIGISFVLGFLSGGSIAAIVLPYEMKNNRN